jgi:hypothetical protein
MRDSERPDGLICFFVYSFAKYRHCCALLLLLERIPMHEKRELDRRIRQTLQVLIGAHGLDSALRIGSSQGN